MEYKRLTFKDIVEDKHLTTEQLVHDIDNLKKLKADENIRSLAGNKFLYHFQMENLCKVKIKKQPSLYDIFDNDILYRKVWDKMVKLNRTGTLANKLFEAQRFNNSVVFFKAGIAKYIYKRFKATSVLDPTAGWGGRMIAAHALNIRYTGIDTNVAMLPAYDGMMGALSDSNLRMIWKNTLEVDYSHINYDLVLTSPPYINLECYEYMTPYESNEKFYKEFLIPLLNKCLAHIKNNGYVCFNISTKMYDDLIKHKYRVSDLQIPMLQQKRLGVDKQDLIYCWTNSKV
jgi:hypothetical protein